jgi:hypothetical protein
MQRLGIPAIVISGWAGESHMWNAVKLYGEYYSMDVTWNDPIGNPANTYYYNYFNITDSTMSRDHRRDDDAAALPTSNGTRYSYANFFGNRPGSDFKAISYGSPKTNLPHIYGTGTSTPTTNTPTVNTPTTNTPTANTPTTTTSIVGTWTHAEDGDVYVFNQNETFSWQYWDEPDTGRWSARDSTITMVFDDGETWSPSYDFRNGTLYIDDDGPYLK